ncbi:MAG: penicillin-binding protein 1C [Spirochaetia bacterium]|nr:penicillin-binding protein 1C [Spirochaetia bacterium]
MKKKHIILLSILTAVSFTALILLTNILITRKKGNILSGIEFSASYSDRNGELLQVFLTSDDKYRIFRPLSDFTPEFIEALLMQEDKYFYQHNGINLIAINKAFWNTYIKKSRRMGASTITMQTAKLKYKIYTKSIPGKIHQIVSALYLETCYSKNQILEAYLNLVPCGGNIEGFETASWYYFNKSIRELNLSENIMLCVLPQNPTKRVPKNGKTPSELISARKVLFNTWIEKHPEDSDKEIYMEMQLSTYNKFPDEARHFTEMLKLKGIKTKESLKTSIDLSIQKKCEEIFSSYLNQNKIFGVKNGAFLLLDWTKMEVIANIGSADYFNDEILGQNNATISKRSPGSALKPFIYALALEQGKIHYDTMLKDTPVTFNEYSPDNFGSVFKGPVKAWYALVDSRNIPAINLEKSLTERDLYDFMKDAGVSNLKHKDYYGLSIVLGTADVTMLELAKMYAVIPNLGIKKEINFIPSKNLAGEKRILSEESAFVVRKMLEENIPPYENIPAEVKNIPIAYKTGTSTGFKDCWSAGIFDKYVLIVWIGNFDGQGNNSFLGRTMATPVMFNMACNLLSEQNKNDFLPQKPKPEKVVQIPVCEVSGALPGPDCPHTELSWFIPGVSPINKCKIHRKINIDTRTGYRTDEEDGKYIKTVTREFWPSDLQSLFDQAGLPRLVPPDYPPEEFKFDYTKQGFAPEITSPLSGTNYVFRKKNTKRNQIVLSAVGDADAKELIWFSGSNFIGRTKPEETLLWTPEPKVYELTVTDTKGRSDTVKINIIETD